MECHIIVAINCVDFNIFIWRRGRQAFYLCLDINILFCYSWPRARGVLRRASSRTCIAFSCRRLRFNSLLMPDKVKQKINTRTAVCRDAESEDGDWPGWPGWTLRLLDVGRWTLARRSRAAICFTANESIVWNHVGIKCVLIPGVCAFSMFWRSVCLYYNFRRACFENIFYRITSEGYIIC